MAQCEQKVRTSTWVINPIAPRILLFGHRISFNVVNDLGSDSRLTMPKQEKELWLVSVKFTDGQKDKERLIGT